MRYVRIGALALAYVIGAGGGGGTGAGYDIGVYNTETYA